MGDAEYLVSFLSIIIPILREVAPLLLLISCSSGYKLSPACFGHMTRKLMSVTDAKLIFVRLGGYARCATALRII